ncbi:hypothetical protein BC749_102878 [Flavobacterium araucananum]|jgi:hypothetical protein|uniref:Uncharacterized protein n=1 Tax=Flavobacterium araucananum TaxID=946678 RepID=A0A227P2S0_9FLAO|nr:hypothetical protein [Flavobacterium araucananum]OXG04191.1 hypothetical protein B0A64_16160 [Flavobacterium araucananum]PWK01302.1 hypothetical protein BC749_102878 [Flavobacterium araucananum]
MNIAFTTILLFIILAPGFIARNAYNSSKLSVKDLNRNLVNDLTWSIIPSLALHTLFIAVLHNTSNYYIDFEQLGNLILGVTASNKAESGFKQLGNYKYAIFTYNFILFTTSFFSGYLIREGIRKLNLDRKIRYFRFSNKWHYIFTGECLDFPDVPDHYEEITDKIINVLCKVNGKNVLYTGEYFNYYIDSKGDLEAVHLRNPIRRYLEHDEDSEEKYYVISSRYLVIPNSDIININFRYLAMQEISENEITELELISLIQIDA